MVTRRLSAILAADVVGYSRLIRADEEGTLAALNALRRDLIDPKIATHHGRIVKLMGDGMLAEFSSVVDAVRFAAEVQQAVAERNAELAQDQHIEFRVGINLGDVVIDGDDIHGDGVNVAARLEGLAYPGGICVSGAVHDQVRDRIDLAFEDMGEQEVKNIDRPIRVWRWASDTSATASEPVPTTKPLPLPDKPSIAVLPFDNMSGDPEQEYFSDGITEDIITQLSRFHWFFVIARNSSFTFKGRAVNVKDVAHELGVRYVLEGSVRRAGDRVRVTAQLVDAETGRHLWVERYDRTLANIFEVQDDITESVAGAVSTEVQDAEIARARRSPSRDLGAWDLELRARWHMARYSKTDNAEAQRLLRRGMEIDPTSARLRGLLAMTRGLDAIFGWDVPITQAITDAVRFAREALDRDDRDAEAHAAMGLAHFLSKEPQDAIRQLEWALDSNPNFANAMALLGSIVGMVGNRERSFALLDKSLRLSPHGPFRYMTLVSYACTEFVAENFAAAAERAGKAVQDYAEIPLAYYLLAASHASNGEIAKAQAAVQAVLRISPGETLSARKRQAPFQSDKDMDRYIEGLRLAGMSE
jgi:adenylate cyclase